MAKVIEFYVSDSLPKKSNYIGRKERGKLIEFRLPKGNQANSNSAQWSGMCMVYIAPFAATLRAVEPTTPCEHYGKRGAIPMRNLGNLGRLIRPASTHLRLLRTLR